MDPFLYFYFWPCSKILFCHQIVYPRLSKCTSEDDGALMACATAVVHNDFCIPSISKQKLDMESYKKQKLLYTKTCLYTFNFKAEAGHEKLQKGGEIQIWVFILSYLDMLIFHRFRLVSILAVDGIAYLTQKMDALGCIGDCPSESETRVEIAKAVGDDRFTNLCCNF